MGIGIGTLRFYIESDVHYTAEIRPFLFLQTTCTSTDFENIFTVAEVEARSLRKCKKYT